MTTYKPTFVGPIQGWATNYAAKNFWRVKRVMEWEDLQQEAYVVFARCAKNYSSTDTAQHFMALYKTAWSRAIIDYSKADTKHRMFVEEETNASGESDQIMGSLDNDGQLNTKIRQAPSEVIAVLKIMLDAPTELLELLQSCWIGRLRANEHVSKILGIDPKLDVMKITEDYFRD